jgi:hypothetical protein
MREMSYEILDEWNVDRVFEDMRMRPILKNFLVEYLRGEKKATINLFTNVIHYNAVKSLQNVPECIYVTQNYAILEFRHIGRYTEGRHYYLIGVNSDGKLFVNKLRSFRGAATKTLAYYVKRIGRDAETTFPIYLTKDEYIYESLGYQVDLETLEIKLIPIQDPADSRIAYRVQGDLVFHIGSEDEFFETLSRVITDRVEEILRRIILERIQNVLADFGISSRIERRFRREIIIFRGIPRDLSWSETQYYLNKIFGIIKKKLDHKDIADNITQANEFEINHENDEIGIDILTDRAGFQERFEPVIINVFFSHKVLQKFVNNIMKNLKLEPQEHIINVGRHLVRYYGYPSRFTLNVKLPRDVNGNEDYLIPINLDLIHAMKGKIYLFHNEHGGEEITVKENVTILITHTEIDEDFENRLNYIALKLIPDPAQLTLL